ncbi:ABC transporter ATP-binding protein [Mycetocola zhujimingii]|uniref:ABC transporter ATP-binding protein n=1 Tax=Mycetocola zhujimingii TaxID=2079792 RepID=A0A2U1TBG2_9MICO|nr:ABC transporter ATP-binding protein [Mycetocola zhujimingii]PWC06229.1 ABC transporter ATP-binding protein [Mycetocola zhujimingii]
MTNAIEIDSVTRHFGRVHALDNVSFTVPEHSIVGLLGRNGAGKTTVMSIMAGQDRPTSGRVQVAGHDPFEHAPTLAQISYVRDNQRYPDDYRLHHVLRIAPDFAPNWSEELAAELVDGFRIPAKTPIKKLSRGQLSSVAIVLGLAARAPVTLLDEPYLGLDVTARAFFHRVLLRDSGEHPRTVVFSTHLIDESASLFDRVVIMDAGRLVLNADSDEASESAWVMSGTTDAVRQLTTAANVLSTNVVGGLMSATGSGVIDSGTLDLAEDLRVQISRASLQQLVAAYGADDAESDTISEVRRA